MHALTEIASSNEVTQPADSMYELTSDMTGPWPLVAGAVALALLNFVTLALAGRPILPL